MKFKFNAIAGLFIVAILWSTGGVLIKWVDWPPMAIAGVRSLIAAGVIWVAFRREPLSFSWVQWAGAAGYCGTVSLFVTATKLTTAANAILLQYTAPIYVAILGGWLLSEKTTRKDWLTVIAVLGGMVFFFLDKLSVGGMIGNLYAIASGVSFAVFILCMRKQKNASPYGSVLLGNLLSFAISIPFLPGISLEPANVAAVTVLGVLQLGLAYVLYSYAICHVKALEATLITSIEPILNPFWVFLFLGETPGMYALIGGCIVLGSITARYWLTDSPAAE